MTRTPDKDDGILNLIQRIDTAIDLPAGRIITFIAAHPREGTSTVARDYVYGLSEAVEHKILLIDAGKIDRSYYDQHDADPAITIAETVAAGKELSDALYPLSHHIHFGRWAGEGQGRGRSRSAAAKLLNDDTFWINLHERFETVVIDAPSLKESPDGISLAARADATVLVVEAEATRQPVIEHLTETLKAAGAKVIGVVLNKRRFYIPAKVYQNM